MEEFANKMASFLESYPREPPYTQKTAQEICGVDRKKVRFVECNECYEKDPQNYKGCNHASDADEAHPDGGPAVGRVHHTKKKKEKLDLANITLGDLFAGLPDRFRVYMTTADEEDNQTQFSGKIKERAMLRVRALNGTLFMNLNETAKSIVIFTKYGLAIGAASDKKVEYAEQQPKVLCCLLGLTFRSATTTLQSGFNVLLPASSDASSSTSEAQAEPSPYTNTDYIKPSKKRDGQVESLLPLPILRERSYTTDDEEETKKIKSLLVVANTYVVAVEDLCCEGLYVGVVGFDLKRYLPKPDKELDISEAGQEQKRALDEEKERLLVELEEWTSAFADFLRQELKEFRMEISR